MPAPNGWVELKQSIISSKPTSPLPAPTSRSRVSDTASTVGRTTGIIDAITGGADVFGDLPVIGHAVTGVNIVLRGVTGTATDEPWIAAIDAGIDLSIFAAEVAGAPMIGVGSYAALIRHVGVGLLRSDDMANYLAQMRGYVLTLSDAATSSYLSDTATTLRVPPRNRLDISHNLLQEASRTSRSRAYFEGYEKALRVLPRRNYPTPHGSPDTAVLCFRHLMEIASNNLYRPGVNLRPASVPRARRDVETYIYQNLLVANMAQQREALQRWARQVSG